MHQDESNKIPHEYIFSWIYTLKIKFKCLSHKVEKLKIDKQKGTETVLILNTCSSYKLKVKFKCFFKWYNVAYETEGCLAFARQLTYTPHSNKWVRNDNQLKFLAHMTVWQTTRSLESIDCHPTNSNLSYRTYGELCREFMRV